MDSKKRTALSQNSEYKLHTRERSVKEMNYADKDIQDRIHRVVVDIWKSHERQDCKDKLQNNQTIVSEMVS
jgi:hypothetical protein